MYDNKDINDKVCDCGFMHVLHIYQLKSIHLYLNIWYTKPFIHAVTHRYKSIYTWLCVHLLVHTHPGITKPSIACTLHTITRDCITMNCWPKRLCGHAKRIFAVERWPEFAECSGNLCGVERGVTKAVKTNGRRN